ncbi:hypothetical protein LXA43DRAFT_1062737 [Ganoderma leucocontextum]|nr:hypothetical protein LXA43DRAFT_1062737 [Ganoderma leucocontextum]
MPSVRLARNSSAVLDSNLQWLAAEAPQFHTQPGSSYYEFTQDGDDDDASGTDDDASGSDSDDDPYHPYNIDEPQKKWVSNGQFVYDAGQLQEGFVAPEHGHVPTDDAPFVPKVEDKDLSPLLHLDSAVNFPSQSNQSHQPCAHNQHGYPELLQQLPQTVSPLEISKPLPAVGASLSDPNAAPISVSTPTHAARRSPLSRTVPIRSSARTKTMKREPSEEGDDDFFLESDADSEDDYVDPDASCRKSKKAHRGVSGQTRYRNRFSSSPYPSSARSSSAGSYASSSAASGSTNSRPGSRNRQVFDVPPPRRGKGWSKIGDEAWQCRWCDHVQGNKRAPDMERHILSHFRDQLQTQWVCCGVPAQDAEVYGVDVERNPWVFKGQLMVGGCHESFSRMDALKRHWNNSNVQCNGSTMYSRPTDE